MPEKNRMSSRRQEASGKAEVGESPSREEVLGTDEWRSQEIGGMCFL